MDCRKLAWLGIGVVGLLAGCTRHEPQQFVPQQPPPPPKAPQTQPVASTRNDKPGKEDSTILDAKPQNCVRIGDFHAELAADPNRAPSEREAIAQQARFAYRRALQIDPKYVPAHMALGRLAEKLGQHDEALASYRAALQIDPRFAPAHIGAAGVLEAQDNRSGAMGVYDAALATLSKDPSLWYERGMCLGRAKQFDAALDSLVHAAALRPKYEDYNKAVGFMLARMGRPDEALPWLTKAMPEADARYNLARMMQHIGQDAARQQQVALALQADPNHIPTLKLLSETATAAPVDTIRTASYRAEEAAEPAQPTALPTRPAEQRLPPPMPVLTDAWDAKPASPPALSATPPAAKTASKPRPTVTVGFEPNP